MGSNLPAVNELAWNAYLDGQYPQVELRTAYQQLKPLEALFVDEYVASMDPRGSAIRAFANSPQKKASPDARALDMMKRPLIQAAIRERMAAAMQRLELTADKVLAEVAKVAFANMGDYVRITGDGEPYVDLSGVNADQMAAITEVKSEDFVEGRGEDARDIRKVSIKLHDKMGALDKLMRYFGLYAPDKLELTGRNGGPVVGVNINMTAEEAAARYAETLGDE